MNRSRCLGEGNLVRDVIREVKGRPIVRTLVYILSVTGSHQRVLSRGIA